MTKSDDKILDVLNETGAALSKTGLEVNSNRFGVRISYSTIENRLPKLIEAGLIKRNETNEHWYEITHDGVAYLEEGYRPPEIDHEDGS